VIRFRDPNEPDGLSRLINRQIDQALIAEHAEQPPRDYLGASVLGDPCARRLAYRYAGYEEEGLDGRRLRIFEAGHVFEDLMAHWLWLAGFKLQRVDPSTGEQWEFTAGGGRVRGHADGIILDGPELDVIGYPLLWEAKSLNTTSWAELARRGIKAATPVYHAQTQIYLSQFELEAALFTAINKDTCALYHALVPVEPGVGWRLVKRGVTIAEMVDRDRLPLRIADQQECRGCGWEQPCHGPIARNSPYQQNKSTKIAS